MWRSWSRSSSRSLPRSLARPRHRRRAMASRRPRLGQSCAAWSACRAWQPTPAFRKWQLDLLLDGNETQATFLAVGEQPVPTPAELLLWDTTPFPDGKHQLRLRVVRSDGNYDEYFTPVTIANATPAGAAGPTLLATSPANGASWDGGPVSFHLRQGHCHRRSAGHARLGRGDQRRRRAGALYTQRHAGRQHPLSLHGGPGPGRATAAP